jgi:ABC-2 type transport system permease protein
MTSGAVPRGSLPVRTRSRRFLGHSLVQLTLVRIREFVREPEAVFWAIFFPILLTIGLGVAFRSRPPDVLKIVATSPTLADSMRREPGLAVDVLAPDAAQQALRVGAVALVVEPASEGVLYRYDETNPEGRAARALADAAIQRAAGRKDPVAARDALVREPGSRYIDFLVPGLVGLGIMSNAVWGIGFSIVDGRRRKLTKRLVATPMSRSYYLTSYLIWRMLILGFEVGLPIGFGAVVFGVPVRGRLIDLGIICVFASVSFSALGLLIASRARTIEAVSNLMNLLQVPMWILSGVFFSAQRFPDIVQPIIRTLPLTAVIDALRAHLLQGASLVQLAPQLGTLGVWLVVCFTLALRLFRWR